MDRIKTFEQFAAENGLVTTADVDGHIHAGLRSKPQTKTYDRWFAAKLAQLQKAREDARRIYRTAIARGEFREPTSFERLESKAAGHDDNASVQAARRVLAKREARRQAAAFAEVAS